MFKFLFKTKIIRRRVTNKGARSEYLKYKEIARTLVHERLEYFNQFYHFSYNKVFIKNTKTKWGSCSSKRNLNFSYKIALLKPELRDYLIVHELCHLGEMNHGKAFWDLVAQQIPDYKKCHSMLRTGNID